MARSAPSAGLSDSLEADSADCVLSKLDEPIKPSAPTAWQHTTHCTVEHDKMIDMCAMLPMQDSSVGAMLDASIRAAL